MLKFKIEKLEDVAEGLRDYYKEKDGAWYLQVDGAKTQADIDRQLAANQSERTAHTATKAKLKDAETKLQAWGELDPDDVTTKLEKLTTLEASGSNPKAAEIQQLIETGVGNRIKGETTKLQRTIDKLTGERDEAVAKAGGLETQITLRGIDDTVRTAAMAANVLPAAIPDLTLLARSAFKLVDGKAQTEDGRDPVQWLEDRKKTAPYLWAPAKGAGGQGGGDGPGGIVAGDNPWSYAGWNVTKQGQVLTKDRAQATKLAEQAGTTIGGPKPAKPAA